jgi:hypothetical protein
MTVGCGSLRSLIKCNYATPRDVTAHLAECTVQLFVQSPQAQRTDMARPVIALRDCIILDRFGADPAQILFLTGILRSIRLRRWDICSGGAGSVFVRFIRRGCVCI